MEKGIRCPSKKDYDYLGVLSKEDLDGTVYIEVQKTDFFIDDNNWRELAKYWKEDSIYFTENSWFYVNSIFENHMEGYDFFYGEVTIIPEIASEVVVSLIEFRNDLQKITNLKDFEKLYYEVYGIPISKIRPRDFKNWKMLVSTLPETINSLVSFMTSVIKEGKNIMVIGI